MRIPRWLMDSLRFMSKDTIEKVADVLIIGDKGKTDASKNEEQPKDDHGHFYEKQGAPCPHKQGKGGTGNNSRERKQQGEKSSKKIRISGKYHEKLSSFAKSFIRDGDIPPESVDKILEKCDNLDGEELLQEAMDGGRHSGLLKELDKQGKKSIEKGIKTQEQTIQDHISWLKDPSKYTNQDGIKTPEKLLLAKLKWVDDIQRNKEETLLRKQYIKKRR